MHVMTAAPHHDDVVEIPRAVRFPIEMIPTDEFDPDRLETWPEVAGRLEYVKGRLLFMPPCGDAQQDTTADVATALGNWVHKHAEFALGTNEAGMRLGDTTRAADAAIWRRADLGAYHGGFRRVPPVLAVEVCGRDHGDQEPALLETARWYLDVGVEVVWIVVPQTRELLVLTRDGHNRHTGNTQVPTHPSLPGLAPRVSEFFIQVSARS